MASKIIWSPTAIRDLETIHAYISRTSVGYADTMVGRIVDAVDRLALFPRIGPPFQGEEQSTRRQLVVRPYLVIYDYAAPSERVDVLTVVHGARDLGDLFGKPGL
jgi:plasmid stabilization system protein ParE